MITALTVGASMVTTALPLVNMHEQTMCTCHRTHVSIAGARCLRSVLRCGSHHLVYVVTGLGVLTCSNSKRLIIRQKRRTRTHRASRQIQTGTGHNAPTHSPFAVVRKVGGGAGCIAGATARKQPDRMRENHVATCWRRTRQKDEGSPNLTQTGLTGAHDKGCTWQESNTAASLPRGMSGHSYSSSRVQEKREKNI